MSRLIEVWLMCILIFPGCKFFGYRNAIKKEVVESCDDRDAGKKVIWTFWNSGAENLRDFNKLNLETWRSQSPDWKIVVVDEVEGSPNHYLNFIKKEDLPEGFSQMKMAQQRSDHVRALLLRDHGGIWMDSSSILLKDLTSWAWEPIRCNRFDMVAFLNSGYSRPGTKEGIENWFLASSKGNKIITVWQTIFRQYWNNREESLDILSHPLFKTLQFSNAFPKEAANYLTQHVSFLRVSQMEIPEIVQDRLEVVDSSEGMPGPPWGDELLNYDDPSFVVRIFRNAKIFKFAGHLSQGLKEKSIKDLKECQCTAGRIYRRSLNIETSAH
ncbi:MAG: hypothetical protein HYW48_10935 [Deltaproteobacteria bacterium]|nr:hypothetical protein [Deltaproteobacteria bacterium]